jgi:transglutaminase superfamily protein
VSSSSIAVCCRYPRPALLGPQLIRLRPADHVRTRVERYQLQIAPEHRLYSLCCIDRLNSPAKAVVRNWLLLADSRHRLGVAFHP